MIRPAVETAMVVGLLGWLYVAAMAAVRPWALAEHIAAVLPMRRDTFGAGVFFVSAACAFVLRARTGAFWVRRPPVAGYVEAGLATAGGYAFLVWVYLGANSMTHPATTGLHLTHFADHPSEGTTAVLCFTVVTLSLFLLRLRGARRA